LSILIYVPLITDYFNNNSNNMMADKIFFVPKGTLKHKNKPHARWNPFGRISGYFYIIPSAMGHPFSIPSHAAGPPPPCA
jgi:hypothetical protein